MRGRDGSLLRCAPSRPTAEIAGTHGAPDVARVCSPLRQSPEERRSRCSSAQRWEPGIDRRRLGWPRAVRDLCSGRIFGLVEGGDYSRLRRVRGARLAPLPRPPSECRVPVLGSRCLCVALRQRRYEPQERLMFGVQRPTAEKCADIDLGYMTARRRVRFMRDEHALRIGLAA
jgi:hypothetical protein